MQVAEQIKRVALALEEGSVVFAHGTDNAWDEAVALVLTVAELPNDKASLAAELTESDRQRIVDLLKRRVVERIPLPYLLGTAWFAELEFLIEPGVVIPRSPIAELIGARFSPWLTGSPASVLDLCCGSGCIGIASALAFAECHLTLADVDATAVTLARRNVDRHGLTQRTQVVRSDLFADLPPGQFDLIVCNPPYVDTVDMRALPPEHRHEPAQGLAGGGDGLTVVHELLAELPGRLNPDGMLVCEVGASAAALQREYSRTGFIWPDLTQGGSGVFILQGNARPQHY
ncbi:MAG: 50S ribosomal protein L3 N(5)-glutamine methyltransferase [Pseudomonadales bacterium]